MINASLPLLEVFSVKGVAAEATYMYQQYIPCIKGATSRHFELLFGS